jgi:hypothetical protein
MLVLYFSFSARRKNKDADLEIIWATEIHSNAAKKLCLRAIVSLNGKWIMLTVVTKLHTIDRAENP